MIHSMRRSVVAASLLLSGGPLALSVLPSGPEGESPLRGRVCLQRYLGEPDPDARGSVGFGIRGETQTFKADVRGLPADLGNPFGVFLEDGPGSGSYLAVGEMTLAQATQGRWVLELEAQGTAPAQLGGAALSELGGRRLEVRDEAGTLYLWALLPGPTAGTNLKCSGLLAPPKGSPQPAATGSLKLQFKASRGCSKFDLRAKGLTEGPLYTVWIEDGAAEGTFAEVGSLVAGRLRKDTKKGDPLPLGVAEAADLSGQAIEVRDGMVVVLTGTVCAPPAPPTGTGLVYFDSDRDGDLAIYSRGLLDSVSVRLTNLPATAEYAPGVSADGEWIAFSRAPDRFTPNEIWKIRSDGMDLTLTQLTNNKAGENQFPTFSPDGTKIVWSLNQDLWVMNAADGSNPQQLTSGPDFDWDASFNADGSKIVFSRYFFDSDLYVMNNDGSGQTLLLGGSASQDHPTWCRAPGYTTWIAFEDDTGGDDEIFVLDTNGGSPIQVTDDSADDDDPVFLVDGSTIYLVWERDDGVSDQIAYRPFPLSGPTQVIADVGNNRHPATAGSP